MVGFSLIDISICKGRIRSLGSIFTTSSCSVQSQKNLIRLWAHIPQVKYSPTKDSFKKLTRYVSTCYRSKSRLSLWHRRSEPGVSTMETTCFHPRRFGVSGASPLLVEGAVCTTERLAVSYVTFNYEPSYTPTRDSNFLIVNMQFKVFPDLGTVSLHDPYISQPKTRSFNPTICGCI
jgi:hypothetical protein